MKTTGFYFALPRALAKVGGADAPRTERNAAEARVVGGVVFLISYLVIARLLLAGRTPGAQILLALPVAFVTWLYWLIIVYLQALVIRGLRSFGLMQRMRQNERQSICTCALTTVYAWSLVLAGNWLAVVGGLWLGAVLLNLLAAMLLTISSAEATAHRA